MKKYNYLVGLLLLLVVSAFSQDSDCPFITDGMPIGCCGTEQVIKTLVRNCADLSGPEFYEYTQENKLRTCDLGLQGKHKYVTFEDIENYRDVTDKITLTWRGTAIYPREASFGQCDACPLISGVCDISTEDVARLTDENCPEYINNRQIEGERVVVPPLLTPAKVTVRKKDTVVNCLETLIGNLKEFGLERPTQKERVLDFEDRIEVRVAFQSDTIKVRFPFEKKIYFSTRGCVAEKVYVVERERSLKKHKKEPFPIRCLEDPEQNLRYYGIMNPGWDQYLRTRDFITGDSIVVIPWSMDTVYIPPTDTTFVDVNGVLQEIGIYMLTVPRNTTDECYNQFVTYIPGNPRSRTNCPRGGNEQTMKISFAPTGGEQMDFYMNEKTSSFENNNHLTYFVGTEMMIDFKGRLLNIGSCSNELLFLEAGTLSRDDRKFEKGHFGFANKVDKVTNQLYIRAKFLEVVPFGFRQKKDFAVSFGLLAQWESDKDKTFEGNDGEQINFFADYQQVTEIDWQREWKNSQGYFSLGGLARIDFNPKGYCLFLEGSVVETINVDGFKVTGRVGGEILINDIIKFFQNIK